MNPLLSEREITVTLEVKISGTINNLQICENFPPGWILLSSNPIPQTPYPYQLLWTLEKPENQTLTYTLRYPQELQGQFVFWGSYEFAIGDVWKNKPISGARTVIITVLTPTPIPTFTYTPIPSATNTFTFIPTSTNTATLFVTPTHTLTPTITPSPSATRTATATLSPTPTASPTPTFTSSPSHTATSTATYTRTQAPSPTHSPSAKPTATPIPSPKPSFTPLITITPTPILTLTITPTPTLTYTPTPSPTKTPTVTASPMPSRTPSRTATRRSTPTASPTRTKTFSPTSTSTQTPTNTPSSTTTPSRTPRRTATKIISPTRTPSRTPTRTATAFATFTLSATFSPTCTSTPYPTPSHTPSPSPKPPTLFWSQKLPDLRVILHQPAYRLLDLDEFWSATTTEPTTVRWRVSAAGTSFGIKLDSENRLSVLNPHSVGTYTIDLQANDGINVLRAKIHLKISHFIFRSAYIESLILLQPNERYRSRDSLYSGIDPSWLPPEQIRFEFHPSLPAGVKSMGIDPDGHYWVEADGSVSVDLSGLLIKAIYVSPTPTRMPSPTPTKPLTTPTPTSEIELNACAQPIRFRQVHTEKVGRGPISLRSADLNQDNYPDWITADYGENTATLLLSKGEGLSFQPYKLYTGEGCLAVELGDWNQDGWMDVALLGGYDSVLTIYHGSRAGAFIQASEIPLQPDPLLPPERMEKGHLRIMTCGHFAPNSPPCLRVALVNQLVGYEFQNNRWRETKRQILKDPPLDLLPMDVDGDGVHELAMTFNYPSRFSLFKESQEGWMEWRTLDLDTPLHGNYAQAVLAARLNSDTNDDAALITFDSTLHIYFGGLMPQESLIKTCPSPIVIHDFISGDFDGNGRADLLWMGFDVQRQKTTLNLLCGAANGFSDETASVELPWPYLLNQNYSLAASDFDADGRLDLVLSDDRENRLIFLKNIPSE